MRRFLSVVLIALCCATAQAQDEHWSRQFAKPRGSTKMLPGTGMSDGSNKPVLRRAKWHDGKLWISGAWECGASGTNTAKAQRNVYWYLWTYSEQEGWRPFSYFHSAKGGNGPDGKINDFLWLPDGRLVVGGEFTRLDNVGGIMHHRVDALAVYDPKEPTANKWQPLGTFQMDGTVSPGGSIQCLAYDPQGNDLYIGGSFGGINNERSGRKYPHSPSIHKFDLDTNSYEPLHPGLSRASAERIVVDTSTKPSTIYVGGSIRWVGGNGDDPRESGSTAQFSTGFASYQDGKGWRSFPTRKVTSADGGWDAILQRAADFKYFDGVKVKDVLVDGKDIYIVGAFSEGKGSGQTLRGIAKWDWDKEIWIDPTGKGGIGREAYSIAKTADGKIYIAGSFGGPTNKGNYDGFKNGDPAAMAAVFDPKTGEWKQVGSGIQGRSMPECRMTVNGNDVYFVGDFNHVGGAEKIESWYIARWNETVDFKANPPQVAKAAVTSNYDVAPTKPWSTGNEHWSRAFPKPPRATGKKHNMTGKTGMSDGTGAPQISGVVKVGDTLYFCGRWEAIRNTNWYVWSHHPEQGWQPVAFSGPQGKQGALSPPKGMKVHGGKIYVYGSITNYAGLGVYDPETKSWSAFEGKNVKGEAMYGNGDPKKGSPVSNIAWDEKTGDTYLLAAVNGAVDPDYDPPSWVGPVVRVDKDGVYHSMGRPLLPENPGKPVTAFDAIYLDKTKDPVDIYVGGTFNYYGKSPTNYARMAYNVVKWSHEEKDWRPIGKGSYLRLSKLSSAAKSYPEGLPGLPMQPEVYHGFIAAGFPRIRCMTMDTEGNIYAGGTVGVVTGTFPVAERLKEETFGIVKYDAKTQKWGPCTTVGGVSRDVNQMTWLDEGRTQMLISGEFHYDNAWNPLHGAAVFDVKTGELSPLGGGLLRWSRAQVISSSVSHFVDGDDWYFAGLFDHAGVNANSMVAAPIESYYVAHWNAKKNMDPNAGMTIGEVAPLQAPAGFSSKSYKVALKATLEGEGTVIWYEKNSSGKFREKGKGLAYTANIRVKGGDGDKVYYAAVRKPDGTEGGKLPVRIPVTPAK